MTTVVDTHAWVWWAVADRRLSRRARVAIERAAGHGELGLSAISIWEVANKVGKGQLSLDRPLDEWLESALSRDGLHVLELTRLVLVDSCRLPGEFHGDPADQIIVATARHRAAVVVTADSRIREYSHVKTIW